MMKGPMKRQKRAGTTLRRIDLKAGQSVYGENSSGTHQILAPIRPPSSTSNDVDPVVKWASATMWQRSAAMTRRRI